VAEIFHDNFVILFLRERHDAEPFSNGLDEQQPWSGLMRGHTGSRFIT
jgi:hypothetical protein